MSTSTTIILEACLKLFFMSLVDNRKLFPPSKYHSVWAGSMPCLQSSYASLKTTTNAMEFNYAIIISHLMPCLIKNLAINYHFRFTFNYLIQIRLHLHFQAQQSTVITLDFRFIYQHKSHKIKLWEIPHFFFHFAYSHHITSQH